MASLMGVAFMLSSLGTLYAESTGEQNNPDYICRYIARKQGCKYDDGWKQPTGQGFEYKSTKDKHCDKGYDKVQVEKGYVLKEKPPTTRSRSAAPAEQTEIAGGFSQGIISPESIKVYGRDTEVLRDENANIRQVKGSEDLMDMVFTDEKTLEIRRYSVKDLEATKKNGLYQIKEGAVPLKVDILKENSTGNSIDYEEVDNRAAAPSKKKMELTQETTEDPRTIILKEVYKKGEGLSETEYRKVTTSVTSIANGEPKEESYLMTEEALGTDGQWYLVGRKAGRRAIYKDEDGFVLLYECDAVNEDGTPITPIATEKTYTYYTDPLQTASFGKVKTLRNNNGYWENKYYDQNSHAGLEMEKTESPWLNTAAHEPGTAPQGTIRTRTQVFCSTDKGTEDFTETVNGIQIAKHWTEKSPVDRDKVREDLHEPHSGGEKITSTIRYRRAPDIPDHLRGKKVRVEHADGNLELYSYQVQGDSLITTYDSGVGNNGAVTQGTRAVIKADKITGSKQEEQQYALQDGQSYLLHSRTGIDFDNAGACTKWVYGGNPDDYDEYTKDCCHVTWERFRDGSEKHYTYNAAGKIVSETHRGITTTAEYNGLTTIVWKNVDGTQERVLVKKETRNLAGNITETVIPATDGVETSTVFSYDVAARTQRTERTFDGGSTVTVTYADGQRKEVTGNTSNQYTYGYEPSPTAGGGIVTTSYSISNDGNSPAGTAVETVVKDLLGQTVKQKTPYGNGDAVTQYGYDAAGRNIRTVYPDGETRLYSFDGRTMVSGMDVNENGVLDMESEPVEKGEEVFDSSWPENKGSWKVTYSEADKGQWIPFETRWTTPDGLTLRSQKRGSAGYKMETHSSFLQQSTHSYSTAVTAPSGISTFTTYTTDTTGRITSTRQEQKDSQGQVVEWAETVFDGWGNPASITHSRTGVHHFVYDPATRLLINETDAGSRTTSHQYDALSRRIQTTFPDGGVKHITYNERGLLTQSWGAQTYPVCFSYDSQGRKTEMTTFRHTSDSGEMPDLQTGDRTLWKYAPHTSNVTEKVYADGTSRHYTYTAGGKQKTETNARGTIKTWNYDNLGQLVSVFFNDGGITPGQRFEYDQWGNVRRAVTEDVADYQYHYNDQGKLIQENAMLMADGGTLDRGIERTYDVYGRQTGYTLKQGDAVEQVVTYSYDEGGRLRTVTSGGKTFHYGYLPQEWELASGMEGPSHSVINTYDPHRDLLTAKTNQWKEQSEDGLISRYSYAINSLEQRTSLTKEGSVFSGTASVRNWEYDLAGQVKQDGENGYGYDLIGNRTSTSAGEGAAIAYTSNMTNQYTGIGEGTTPTYDADGNRTGGLLPGEGNAARHELAVTYDANNRVVEVRRNGQTEEAYAYDHLGRRVRKGNSVILYDGYNAIAEYGRGNRGLRQSYVWGKDLSSSTSGNAGGVGGLLMVTDHEGQLPRHYYPLYDGNGNITEYLDGANRTVAAHYEYDAFGEVIRKTGDRDFTYQFSTKPYDGLTGWNYYNFRSYDAGEGRFTGRDPQQEMRGLNLYALADNDAVNAWDYLGLSSSEKPCCCGEKELAETSCCKDLSPIAGKECTIKIIFGHYTTEAQVLEQPIIETARTCVADRVGIVSCYSSTSNEKVPARKYYPNDDRVDGPLPVEKTLDAMDKEIAAAKKEAESMCFSPEKECCTKVTIYLDPDYGQSDTWRWIDANREEFQKRRKTVVNCEKKPCNKRGGEEGVL